MHLKRWFRCYLHPTMTPHPPVRKASDVRHSNWQEPHPVQVTNNSNINKLYFPWVIEWNNKMTSSHLDTESFIVYLHNCASLPRHWCDSLLKNITPLVFKVQYVWQQHYYIQVKPISLRTTPSNVPLTRFHNVCHQRGLRRKSVVGLQIVITFIVKSIC